MAQIVGLPRRIGNSETDALVSFVTYDARDRLLTESTGEVTLNYGYNANGSLTTKHEGSVLQSEQVWDVRGRLAGMKDGSGNWLSQYRYTPEGTRSAVTEGGTTTLYVVDALSPSGYAQVIEERTAAGVVVGSYVYGPALDPLSQWRDGQGANLHLADGHSGVRQAVSLAGVVLLAQRFDAYGVTVASAGTLANVIGYRGERFNGTLGQYYLRARFYNPMSGRFTGMDPFAGNYGDPSQAMRYGYAGANPVGAMDPSGRMSFGSTLAGLSVRVGLVGGALGAVSGGLRGYGKTRTLGGTLRGAGEGFVGGFLIGAGSVLAVGGAVYLASIGGLFASGVTGAGLIVATTEILTVGGILLGTPLWINGLLNAQNEYDVIASMFELVIFAYGIRSAGRVGRSVASDELPRNPTELAAEFESRTGIPVKNLVQEVRYSTNGDPEFHPQGSSSGGPSINLPHSTFYKSITGRMMDFAHEVGHAIAYQVGGGSPSAASPSVGSRGHALEEASVEAFARMIVETHWGPLPPGEAQYSSNYISGWLQVYNNRLGGN